MEKYEVIAEVKRRLYEKYIAPTENKKKSYIGIEIELPIVNLNREPVSFDVIFQVTEKFMSHFAFEAEGVDSNGHVYAAIHKESGDILSYDCSYNNLELSMGKGDKLCTLRDRFETYYRFLQDAFGEQNHMLTGMGVNPYRELNHNVPIENERYRMLFHHLHSYDKYQDEMMYFHPYPTYGTFSSASQVQLDVKKENLLTVIRAFSKLEPIKALLLSNSMLLGEREDLVCCRDMFWECSTHGINPHNIGMFDALPETIEELQAYIESESMYCVMRDGRYINFRPTPVLEYFAKDSLTGEMYVDGEYQTVTFRPELDDLEFLRTFKFEDLTFRGTIEFRSGCCQPVKDSMVIAAFHLGLMEKLNELDQLLEDDHVIYHHGFSATELRRLFVKRTLPGFVDTDALYDLAKRIVQLAENGLQQRGFGEELFLQPLYDRIASRQNPAEHMLTELEKGTTLEALVKEYGTL